MNKLVALSLASSILVIPTVAQKAPNVVFFLVDDLGWKDIAVYGSDFHQTPHIDALAREGVLFTNAYSACTVSSPSRAAIMTGKYPAKLHLTDWIKGYNLPNTKLLSPDWTMFLPLEEVTTGDIFHDAGYKTAHIGKWHLGDDEKYWPENQGFDINIGGCDMGSPRNLKSKNEGAYFPPHDNPRLANEQKGEYLTERLTREACAFIDSTQNKPFFLNLWFYNVHTPLQARQDKIDKYEALADPTKIHTNPIYAAMVEHMDDAVGKVIEKLKALGLYENTIIVFTSDNGGLIGKNKKVTSNVPLRAGKGEKYEGGVRVPLIIKNVGHSPISRSNDTPVMGIDFLPTLADLAAIPLSENVKKGLDGVSFAPIVKDNSAQLKRRNLYWHYPHYHTEGASPYSAIRKDDWKLIHIIETDTYELYNLKKDGSELNNLVKEQPKTAKKLRKELEHWIKEVGAQMPIVRP